MSWEDIKLGEHLADHDLSNARDAAITERSLELMADDGPNGYGPYSERIMLLASEKFDSDDMLKVLQPYLVAGDYAGAGSAVVCMLMDIAEKEAAEEARIQIDRLLDEPTAAQELDFDARLCGGYED